MADAFKAREATPAELEVCSLIEQVAMHAELRGMTGMSFCVLLFAICGKVLANHNDAIDFRDVEKAVQDYLLNTLHINYMNRREELSRLKKEDEGKPNVGN